MCFSPILFWQDFAAMQRMIIIDEGRNKMLSAKTEKGLIISLNEYSDIEEIKKLQVTHNFYCPVCNERVMMRLGLHRRWHFAHFRQSTCGTSEGESDYHLQGKELLFDWFSKQNIQVDLEPYISSIQQRPDLYLPQPYHIPIEFQCSTIRDQLFLKRTFQYKKIDKPPLWILGGNRLKRSSEQIFQLTRMDWLTLNENERTPQQPYILYFCPTSEQFALLSNIIPYSTTKTIAHITYIDRKKFTFEQLRQFQPQQPITSKNWLQIKTNWRNYPYRRQTAALRYVSRMLQTLRSDVPLYPAEAGLPTEYLYWFETPAYLWQTWLLIQCVIPLKHGQNIQFQTIYSQMKRLVHKGVIVTRKLPLIESSHFSFAIMDYLIGLCRIGILRRVGKSTFEKIGAIHVPMTLDEALEQDHLILGVFQSEHVR